MTTDRLPAPSPPDDAKPADDANQSVTAPSPDGERERMSRLVEVQLGLGEWKRDPDCSLCLSRSHQYARPCPTHFGASTADALLAAGFGDVTALRWELQIARSAYEVTHDALVEVRDLLAEARQEAERLRELSHKYEGKRRDLQLERDAARTDSAEARAAISRVRELVDRVDRKWGVGSEVATVDLRAALEAEREGA